MCFPAPVFFCSKGKQTLKGKSSARWSSTLCVCGGVPHDFLLAFFFEQKQAPVGGLYPRNKKSANNSTKETKKRRCVPQGAIPQACPRTSDGGTLSAFFV